MRKNILIWIFSLIALNVFSYDAPLGTRIGRFSNTFDKAYILGTGSLSPVPAGSTCFTFLLKMNIASGAQGEIFPIRNKNRDETLLKVGFTTKGRIFVSRPFNGKGFVDYEIYDKLLDYSGSGSKQYEFRLFLCGSFIWLESKNGSSTWVSPLFWGIDLPGENLITKIADRDSSLEFIFGGLNNVSKLAHANFEVYASKYTELWNDISNNYVPKVTTRATGHATETEQIQAQVDQVKVYPIPVSTELNVDLDLESPCEVIFEIYSMQGTLLYKEKKSYSSSGTYHEVFQRSKITGNTQIAVLLIQGLNKVVSKKIIFK